MADICEYKSSMGYVVKDEGEELSHHRGVIIGQCKSLCDKNVQCNSLKYCQSKRWCYLKQKVLTGTEPMHTSADCTTYYRKCNISGNHTK